MSKNRNRKSGRPSRFSSHRFWQWGGVFLGCLTLWGAGGSSAGWLHAFAERSHPDSEWVPPVDLNSASLAEMKTEWGYLSAVQRFSNLGPERLRAIADIRNAKGDPIFGFLANEPGLWSTLDPDRDQVQGTSTDLAHEEFKNLESDPEIIVAVLDNGMDIEHPDLRGKIWTNGKEIPNNGVDDDQNGYVDDIHGWNFLGGIKNGKPVNVISDTLEVTREYLRLRKLAQRGPLSAEDQVYYQFVQKDYFEQAAQAGNDIETYALLEQSARILQAAGLRPTKILKPASLHLLKPVSVQNGDAFFQAKAVMLKWIESNPQTAFTLQKIYQSYQAQVVKLTIHYSQSFEASRIIGDDPTQLQPVCATAFPEERGHCVSKGHGNADVTGSDSNGKRGGAMHGTHVAGIIAAIRDNQLGILGQAQKVKIMPVRMVPDGDEHDRHIAKAIRYAVDNGAKVINMSFGKPYSPQKHWVDQAVRYAEKRGVMLVHAAGNSGINTEDSKRKPHTRRHQFPNPNFYDSSNRRVARATNWLEVGASNPSTEDGLRAYFSNFGKTSVDLFAPGTGIVSTVPYGKYESAQGTSMAAPQVAGAVAVLMNWFPQVTPSEIYQTMLATVNRYEILVESVPGTIDSLAFRELSRSGGTLNLRAAARRLQELKKPGSGASVGGAGASQAAHGLE